MANKLVIEGSYYSSDANGEHKLLDNRDITNGDGIVVESKEDGSVQVTSDLGIKIVNGIPCIVYAVDETEV